MPNRVLISICDTCQSPVDHDNCRGSVAVVRIEEAAGQQWNTYSAKIIRADFIAANRRQRMFATRIPKRNGAANTTAERRTWPGASGDPVLQKLRCRPQTQTSPDPVERWKEYPRE